MLTSTYHCETEDVELFIGNATAPLELTDVVRSDDTIEFTVQPISGHQATPDVNGAATYPSSATSAEVVSELKSRRL